MLPGPVELVAFVVGGVCVCVGVFAILRRIALRRLQWRQLTPNKCLQYLVARGWSYAGGDQTIRLDKGDFRIKVDCIALDPATRSGIDSVLARPATDDRLSVVVVPGAIAPGLSDWLLSRRALVICYARLAELEDMLREQQKAIAAHHDAELRLRASALYPPTKATLLPAGPIIGLVAADVVDVLVAETEHVQCYLRDAGGDTLLISFNDSWRSGKAGRLQPGIDMAGLGFSILDFVTRAPNWFPADDMAALVPAALDRLGGRFARRVTFGFSQGGYGAIKYSRALRATTTIAFSPQVSIDARAVGAGRFTGQFRTSLNAGMGIESGDCTCRSFLFYDPYDEQDQSHAARIGGLAHCVDIRLPFAGHATSQLFATRDGLHRIVAACQSGDTPALMLLAAGMRHSLPNRAVLMAMHLAATKPVLAMRIAQAHRTGWSVAQQVALYYQFAVKGQAQMALAWIESLAADRPDDEQVQGAAALIAIEAGQTALAARFVDRARKLNPANPKWRHVEERIRLPSLAGQAAAQ